MKGLMTASVNRIWHIFYLYDQKCSAEKIGCGQLIAAIAIEEVTEIWHLLKLRPTVSHKMAHWRHQPTVGSTILRPQHLSFQVFGFHAKNNYLRFVLFSCNTSSWAIFRYCPIPHSSTCGADVSVIPKISFRTVQPRPTILYVASCWVLFNSYCVLI